MQANAKSYPWQEWNNGGGKNFDLDSHQLFKTIEKNHLDGKKSPPRWPMASYQPKI